MFSSLREERDVYSPAPPNNHPAPLGAACGSVDFYILAATSRSYGAKTILIQDRSSTGCFAP